MRCTDKVKKTAELGKTLSKYGLAKAKSIRDPEMKNLRKDLTKKWVRVAEQKSTDAMDKAIELANMKLEDAQTGNDKLSLKRDNLKVEMKDAIDRADSILEKNQNSEVEIDEEYKLMKKQLKELEALKEKQAKELEDLKNKNS
ncbi:hypothetical protein BGI41_06275 [Methanobrevibacter sp. 87.7]|uniref:hypothetical protein n=1 Tax=Methanobrevibacter sp. 87.7 TaxID=387957 RepID=UPI000B507C7A|nr:hypothetical protein [Methanobrevibacter sp. 87.7]OWT32705.1 hypothetical protein BGI41_06275 [Methanobrevibacter sp. 87.7]